MEGALERALELHRSTRARTLVLVRSLTQAQLDYPPSPGSWSVGQVADHLILSDRLSREDIARLIQLARSGAEPVISRSLRDLGVSFPFVPQPLLALAEIPLWFSSSLITDPVRDFLGRIRFIPIETPRSAVPRRGRPGDELRAGLRDSFEETEALIEANADLDYRKLYRRDPLLGKADLAGILRFLASHEQRHQGQICDVLTDGGFPGR